MDKLQEVFEQQFAEQIKTLIDEALTRVDIAELVENTVSERFNNGNFQQYINDTIQHHVNSVNISETAVARLEQNGQKILQQQILLFQAQHLTHTHYLPHLSSKVLLLEILLK